MTKQYAQRDIESLDGYMTHLMAMTAEQLHNKSDIAAELAWRDSQIAALRQMLDAMAAENAALKSVLEPKEISDEIQDLFNDTVKLDGDSDGYHEWSWVDNPDEVIIAVMNAMPKPETPATDAYRNSVRAEGVDIAVLELKALAKRSVEEAPKASEHIHASALYLITIAAQLRSGTHDTADKAG
ncbi:hypothetical protein [Pantoea stewartii]|uniref:hypothetical protein n=1 Tax=Pantoea stewartii TaxID=66269 RepID=UPI001981E2F8|nr:hypothetical protein [Pantoea stewartii]